MILRSNDIFCQNIAVVFKISSNIEIYHLHNDSRYINWLQYLSVVKFFIKIARVTNINGPLKFVETECHCAAIIIKTFTDS